MRIIGRRFSLRSRTAVFGAAAGFHLFFIFMLVLLPFYFPRGLTEAGAQTVVDMTAMRDQLCWMPVECNKAFASDPGCLVDPGCCLGDRCFVPGGICPKGGDASSMQGQCYAKSPPFTLSVRIGAIENFVDLGEYLSNLYQYGVGIAGMLAAVMMMIGGFQYLTAGGDAEKVSKGKRRITDALIGLFLTMGAYLLLNTINPDTVRLQLPKIPLIKRQMFIGCVNTELCAPCGDKYTVYGKPDGTPPDQGDCVKTAVSGKPGPAGLKALAQCTGKSCVRKASAANDPAVKDCDDSVTRCRRPRTSTMGGAPPEVATDAQGNKTFTDEAVKTRCGMNKPAAGQPGQPAQPGQTGQPGQPQGGSAAQASAADLWICSNCLPDGRPCGGGGLEGGKGKNDFCCSGYCSSKGRCDGGQPGDTCDDNKDCASGICQTNWANSCSAGEVGAPCAGNSECKPGFKCQTLGRNHCSPGTAYSWCDGKSECQSGMDCKNDMCIPKGEKIIYCNEEECPAGRFCAPNFICTDGSVGAMCDWNSQCANNHCAANVARACTSGAIGARCNENSDCQSCHCLSYMTDFSVCTTGMLGARCGKDEDCMPKVLNVESNECDPSPTFNAKCNPLKCRNTSDFSEQLKESGYNLKVNELKKCFMRRPDEYPNKSECGF